MTTAYDATVVFLTERYGPQYEHLDLGPKTETLTTLANAIRLMDDDSDGVPVDPDTAWDTAKDLYGYHLPEGFDFPGVTGRSLDILIRSQFDAIAAQIGGGR